MWKHPILAQYLIWYNRNMPSYYDPMRGLRKARRRREVEEAEMKEYIKKLSEKPKTTPDKDCLILGREIANLRKNAGMTQKKLGEILKTSQSKIARIELGHHNLTIKNVRRIARAFGKELNIIIK